jgi:cytochrome P450
MTTELVDRLRGLLEAQAASHGLNRDALPAMLAAFDHLWNLVDTLTIDREKQGIPGDGLLDLMIAAKKAGKINDTEIRQNLVSLLTGGYDTTKNMLGLTIHMLLQHPDQWERCAGDRAYCDKVTEEMLRHSSIGSVYRWVGEDFVYADVKFPKDSVLTFLMGMAGRDPSAFPEPMDFQPEKVHANRHVAFGRGVHICIGQYLARAQIEEAVHILAQRLCKAKIAGEVKWRQYLGVWGLSSLPLEFEPAPLRAQSTAV